MLRYLITEPHPPALTSYFSIEKKVPELKDLQSYFTPQYATQWKVIGTQLDIPSGRLDIIEHDNHYRAVECCNAMLIYWLQKNASASWSELFEVIKSPAVSCSAPGKGNCSFICIL